MYIILFSYHVNGFMDEYGTVDFGFAPTLSQADEDYLEWCEEVEDSYSP